MSGDKTFLIKIFSIRKFRIRYFTYEKVMTNRINQFTLMDSTLFGLCGGRSDVFDGKLGDRMAVIVMFREKAPQEIKGGIRGVEVEGTWHDFRISWLAKVTWI